MKGDDCDLHVVLFRNYIDHKTYIKFLLDIKNWVEIKQTITNEIVKHTVCVLSWLFAA